jgi:glycosyltransferase involved in cell wall biosynthesis
MRILVVATHIQLPGAHGGATHVAELIAHLQEHGPTLCLARRGSRWPDTKGVAFWPGLAPRGLGHVLSAAYLPAALHHARRFAPDVIYERGSSMGLGTYLSALLGCPLLVMVLDEHVSPLSLRRARRLIATNLELVPAPFRGKAVRVSWGANTQRFRPDLDGRPARERLGIPATATVVAYTGSLQPWHDLEGLVAAAGALRDREVVCLIVGDGEQRPGVEELVAREGLEARFRFTGRVAYDEVPALLAAADICVAPFDPNRHRHSRERGYALDPLKVFEYLAMAKPTITIHAGNIERLFNNGEHVTLVQPSDPRALEAAIRGMIDHPEAARAQARRGYEQVVGKHTWRAHAAHLAELFQGMLEQR